MGLNVIAVVNDQLTFKLANSKSSNLYLNRKFPSQLRSIVDISETQSKCSSVLWFRLALKEMKCVALHQVEELL